MMRLFCIQLMVCLLFSTTIFAQYNFEEGYYINNEGDKITGLILNKFNQNNPTDFRFKKTKDDKAIKLSIDDVQEFGLGEMSKYQRFTVEIDRSSDSPRNLTEYRAPKFNKEILFLKVLVEGKATLYAYNQGNLNRFFYKVDEGAVTQLVYKRFIKGIYVEKNEAYRSQLLKDVKCGIELETVQKIAYKRREMIEFFMNYNACVTGNTKVVRREPVYKGESRLKLKAGLGFSEIKMGHLALRNFSETKLSVNRHYRLGFEFESVFPSLTKRVSFFCEPTYQFYSATESVTPSPDALYPPSAQDIKVTFHSIELSGTPVPMVLHYTLKLEVGHGIVNFSIDEVNYETIPNSGQQAMNMELEALIEKERIKHPQFAQKYHTKTMIEVGEIIGEFSAFVEKELY